ncbi:MAG TPA: rhodanese-like domain-containing protein, partial [Kofleriaceae bacterium]|nr:rhodanese-like domain-containing protein [Kofleriaceae bacterium]
PCAGFRRTAAHVHDNRRLANYDVVRYNGPMVATVSPQELAGLLSNPKAHLIDVRDADEWAGGHLDGARSVPLDQLRSDPERELAHDGVLVFICAKGVRSLTAAKLAERLGYQSIYNVEGGTSACARAGWSLVAARAAA